jgi:hypothetical protein
MRARSVNLNAAITIPVERKGTQTYEVTYCGIASASDLGSRKIAHVPARLVIFKNCDYYISLADNILTEVTTDGQIFDSPP